ncbi:MAG: SMI1/KNR4 family protein [Myxococcota bacterium]
MRTLLAQLVASHPLNGGATNEEISAAERRIGFPFPAEYRDLLAAANGGPVWESGELPSTLLTAAELEFVSVLMESDDPSPPGLVAILRQESNYVALDMDPTSSTLGFVVDCSHETFPFELGLVAESISEMLDLLNRSGGAEWVWPAVVVSGRDLAEDG